MHNVMKDGGNMTDKRIKMNCPFCHTKAEQIQIKIWNTNCGCAFHGTGIQNLIDKWNRR